MSELKIEFNNGLKSLYESKNSSGSISTPKINNANSSQNKSPVTFADLFSEKIAESNELTKEADSAVEELVSGKNKDLHGTMIALEKADISFRMLTQVRNKMIEAYKEIMRMQV